MATKNIFITGNTDLLILSILKKEDTYAYDIAKQINAFSRGDLNLSNNTIYTATYKLENNGYISEYSRQVGKKRTRVYYHLEKEGELYLRELYDNYIKTMRGTNLVLKEFSDFGEGDHNEFNL